MIIFCIHSTHCVHSIWQVTFDSPWTSRECSWCVATWILCNRADSEWPGRVALYSRWPEKIFFYHFALVQHMKHCHCFHYLLSLLLWQGKTHGVFSCIQRKQNQLRRRNILQTNCSFCFTWCTLLLNIKAYWTWVLIWFSSHNVCCNIHRTLVSHSFIVHFFLALMPPVSLHHFLISTLTLSV